MEEIKLEGDDLEEADWLRKKQSSLEYKDGFTFKEYLKNVSANLK